MSKVERYCIKMSRWTKKLKHHFLVKQKIQVWSSSGTKAMELASKESDRNLIAQMYENLIGNIRLRQQKEYKHARKRAFSAVKLASHLDPALVYGIKHSSPRALLHTTATGYRHHSITWVKSTEVGDISQPVSLKKKKKDKDSDDWWNKVMFAEYKQRFHSTRSSLLSHQIALSF